MIQKFIPNTPQPVLDDLKSRIKNTRWPFEFPGSGWTFGADLGYMKELADYWANDFDWRITESEINSYPNFIAEIDGYKIHFLHIKGKGKNSLPLIITHGWPGSFLEFLKLIPLLTENTELSFDLVIPSMPGFGYSDPILDKEVNAEIVADLFHQLMEQLGYKKYGAQGGDFGAGVASYLALRYPVEVIGIHLNYISGNYRPELKVGETFTHEEINFIHSEEEWYLREGGYALQQKTRPLTLAYGLNDSPVGLCAWIVEKMCMWADSRGNIEKVFTKDELLSNVTLYWVTQSIHSSMWLYGGNSKNPLGLGTNAFISVPVGIAKFRYEDPLPPLKYISRGFNVQRWTEFDKGGHFAAMEQPELLAEDIVKFFRDVVHSS